MIRLREAVGTAGTTGDYFAQLGPGEFLFIPIAHMQSVDLEPKAGTPVAEFILMEKALG